MEISKSEGKTTANKTLNTFLTLFELLIAIFFSCRSTNAAISAHSGCPASDASGSAHTCRHCANAGSGQIHLCCCPGNSISCGHHDTAEFHPWGWCKFLPPEILSFPKTLYLSRLPLNMVFNWLRVLLIYFVVYECESSLHMAPVRCYSASCPPAEFN